LTRAEYRLIHTQKDDINKCVCMFSRSSHYSHLDNFKKSHPILNYSSSSGRSHSPYRHIRSLHASIYMYPSLPARTHRSQTLRKGCYLLNSVLPNISCPHKGREPFRILAALVLAPRLCSDCHLWVCKTNVYPVILLFSYPNIISSFS